MTVTNNTFPHPPHGWSIGYAEEAAKESGLTLSDDHWDLIRALQEYYHKAEHPKLRQLKDALDENFHSRGGMKYLYKLFPGGPVAEGCRIAGLAIPAGAVDKSFGSTA